MKKKKQIHVFIAEELDKEVTKLTEDLGMTKSELVKYGIFEAITKLRNIVGDKANGKKEK